MFNGNYVAYFDLVMTELWREAAGGYQAMLERGTDMVVAEVRVRYLAPAGFDDELELEALITRIGTTATTTRIEVSKGGLLVAEGELRHVFVDPATGAKTPIPNDVRRALQPYLAAAEAVPS